MPGLKESKQPKAPRGRIPTLEELGLADRSSVKQTMTIANLACDVMGYGLGLEEEDKVIKVFRDIIDTLGELKGEFLAKIQKEKMPA